MARGDKPYRVYRGGRVKGKVPTLPRPERAPSTDGRRDGDVARPARAPRRRRFGWGRRVGLVLFLLVALVAAWAVTSYLAVARGVDQANRRLEPGARAALAPQEGLLLSRPTTVLLLGTDHANTEARASARRSDTMMIVRTDPRRARLAYLSIPRDLRVDIPRHGASKINAAFQIGGPALAIRTVRAFTGIEINHVAVVDFASFEQVIDAVGGIEVDVPAPILSNKFDCPYATQAQCSRWEGWRFEKGKQKMNGRRALVYARIRQNRLDRGETDITRGERQQQVMQALTRKILSPRTLARLPWIGDELFTPLATDLSAGQFTQLAWVRYRATPERTLHCRLGGTPSDIGGQSVLLPSEENRNVVAMFVGASAAQPPAPGSGPFGPGCVVGTRRAVQR